MCRTKYSAPQYLFLCCTPFIPLGSETLKEENLEVGTKTEIPRVHEILEQGWLLSIRSFWHV